MTDVEVEITGAIDYLIAHPIELAHIQANIINAVVNTVGISKRSIFLKNYFSRSWPDLLRVKENGDIGVNVVRRAALCTPYPAMNRSQTVRYALGLALQSKDPTFTDSDLYRMTFGGNAVNGSYGNGPHYGIPEFQGELSEAHDIERKEMARLMGNTG
jgi:hypothetical protein